MPLHNHCYYKQCHNTKRSCPELTFHRFPKERERLIAWIERSGHDVSVEEDFAKWRNRSVCSIHFDQVDFKIGRRPILNHNAVPKDFRLAEPKPSDVDSNEFDHGNNNASDRSLYSSSAAHGIKKSCFNDHTVARLLKNLTNARRAISKLRCQNSVLRRKVSRYQKFSEKWNVSRLAHGAKIVIKDFKKLFLIEMQMRHLKKNGWSEAEQEFALSLYQRSSRCYGYLRNECKMALPCVTLIRKWMNELQICTDNNRAFLAKLTNKVESLTEHEKETVLM